MLISNIFECNLKVLRQRVVQKLMRCEAGTGCGAIAQLRHYYPIYLGQGQFDLEGPAAKP